MQGITVVNKNINEKLQENATKFLEKRGLI